MSFGQQFAQQHTMSVAAVLAAKNRPAVDSHQTANAYAAGYSDRQRGLAPDCEGVKPDAYFRGYCERLAEEIAEERGRIATIDCAHESDLAELDNSDGRHNWWGLADESHSAQ